MEATLGKRITAHRKQLGLTQDQLAEKLGITAQAISKWENDLSCPDISMLPKLADIFDTTTDALLGRETPIPVCETVVVDKSPQEENGFVFDNGKLDLHWNSAKFEGVGLACWVILTGIIYLVTQLLTADISFWTITWQTFLLVFGLFGLYPKFSAFRLGCALAGSAFLLSQFFPIHLENGVVIAALVVLFGLALLADALRKNKRSKFAGNYKDKFGKFHHGNPDHTFSAEDGQFTYEANFGNSTQLVVLETLRSGVIETNFGEYIVDLSGVNAVEPGCKVDAESCFGTQTILVPRRFTVIPDSTASFAGFEILGQPDPATQGSIRLCVDVNFGQITVRYI